jgi:carbon-monoxide dehydrogenase large subunit
MTEAARRYMGNSVPRKEDPALLTGHTNFTDDIRLLGMLHMALLRSPYAHARITSIDTSAAKEQPGVVAVFTSENLADEWDGSVMDAAGVPATRSTSTNRPRTRPTSPHRVGKSPPMYPTPSRETGQDNADEE